MRDMASCTEATYALSIGSSRGSTGAAQNGLGAARSWQREHDADRARGAALSVAIVERELVGGDCWYRAHVPSKALLRPVVAVADARRVNGAREAINGPLDAAATFARRDGFVDHWQDDATVGLVKGIGAELLRGHGRLDGPRRVAVETLNDGRVVLSARHTVAVCTGSRAALPDLPGIAEARPWISRDATSASAVPERLAIVGGGGGGVGVEMSSAWQGLGASVTLLARDARLLPRMEPFVGELVARGLAEAGVNVRTGVSVTRLSRPSGTGPVTLLLDDGGELEADEVLFAIGRAPLTDDIGLETVGLVPGSWLEVDCTCQVRAINDGWLYALGEVNHHAILTHQGKYQARIAGDAIAARAAGRPLDTAPWGAHAATADSHAVPQVLFCDPRPPRSASPPSRPSGPGIVCGRSTPSSARSKGRACTPTVTGVARGWWSTSTTATCLASPSSARASPSCSTPLPSPSPARSMSTGSATPCPASRLSARSGCSCWRPTEAKTRGGAMLRTFGARPGQDPPLAEAGS
jgi:pyruvate/2-oxoglutarate dehydrogenase complex dihydrolipoamide dehydrogenase (E3) component